MRRIGIFYKRIIGANSGILEQNFREKLEQNSQNLAMGSDVNVTKIMNIAMYTYLRNSL